MITRSLVESFSNEGGGYELIPIYRREVVPGQSLNIRGSVKMQTAAFTENLLSGALLEAQFFYVPNRLVWSDWISFVTRDDNYAGTYPTNNTAWSLMWEKSGTYPSFYRRGYKLIYNSYFGSEDAEDTAGTDITWYDDITTDTDTDVHRLMTTEQMAKSIHWSEEMEAPTYDGTATPIDLVQFDEEMRNAISGLRARTRTTSGNRYVDMLKEMGVNASWQIAQVPQRLSKHSVDVFPAKTFDTSATSTGQSTARFEGTVNCNFQLKASEHGYVIGVAFLRPHLYNTAVDSPWDNFAHANGDVDSYWLGDNETGRLEIDEAQVSGGATSADKLNLNKHLHLMSGAHLVNSGTWVADYSANNHSRTIWIDDGDLPVGAEIAKTAAFLGNFKGRTTLPFRAEYLY